MDGVELRPGWAFDFVLHGSGMHGIGHGRVVYGERDRSGVLVDRWVGVPKLVSPITRAATASGFVSDWAY
jgi:hypothetical protein